MDLRERVIAAIKAGEQSQAQMAVTLGVDLRTVEKGWQRWRETGGVAAWAHGGGNPRVLAGCERVIRAALKKQPDATLDELCTRVWVVKG